MGWNDERVELLKKLWNEGLSASQIAGRLGGVTRNAVIGKVHRLGLSGRVTPTRTLGTRRPRTRDASQQLQQQQQRRVVRPRPMIAAGASGAAAQRAPWQWEPSIQPEGMPEAAEEIFIPLEDRKSVLQLKEGDCRWPIGDPQHADFHFCGHGKHESLPYCEFHARKAYQPPQSMRRREHRDAGADLKIVPVRKVTAA
jgi:GcrA cell cycle regulator